MSNCPPTSRALGRRLQWLHENPDAMPGVLLEDPRSWFAQRFESTPFMTSTSPDGSMVATSHDGFVQLDGRCLAVADEGGMRVQVTNIGR